MAAHLKNHKGILFDFDGVLARTMEDNFRAWARVFNDIGVGIAPEQFYPLEGMRLQEVALKLCNDAGVFDINIDEIVRGKEMYYLNDHTFSLYPGVEELVNNLWQAKIPMGIVTAGGKERIQKTLDSGLYDTFSAVITNENGGRGKPYPDPYLAGAKALGITPEECIVVENAPLGIQAAKAAGAYCIAIASTMGKEKLQRADEIVEYFRDIRRSKKISYLLDNPHTLD